LKKRKEPPVVQSIITVLPVGPNPEAMILNRVLEKEKKITVHYRADRKVFRMNQPA